MRVTSDVGLWAGGFGRRTLDGGHTPSSEEDHMAHTMSRNVRWSVWMTIGGLITAALVYAFTSSLGWAAIGLIGAGIGLNLLARR
jgi:hypothetical protein